MPDIGAVAAHYTRGDLLDAIASGVERLGKTLDEVCVEDLAPVDEFHIGGRGATESFLDQVGLVPEDHVLDVGCGLGGSSRLAAESYGCRVTGVDLTREYIETGKVLCAWVGLEERVSLDQGDATAMPYGDDFFDKAFMLHVGMNIADKASLAREIYRVLAPGGTLGIYDVMRMGDGEMKFPVPWATNAEESVVASPDDYIAALESAGFRISAKRNRREFALEFFEQLRTNASSGSGPPPLGLHLVMGEGAPTKIRNMIENISDGLVAPFELIAQKPS